VSRTEAMIENRIMSRQPRSAAERSYLDSSAAHTCVLLRLALKRLALPMRDAWPVLVMM
jgi:hypothetical protein